MVCWAKYNFSISLEKMDVLEKMYASSEYAKIERVASGKIRSG